LHTDADSQERFAAMDGVKHRGPQVFIE
jgi:hypothetical protein